MVFVTDHAYLESGALQKVILAVVKPTTQVISGCGHLEGTSSHQRVLFGVDRRPHRMCPRVDLRNGNKKSYTIVQKHKKVFAAEARLLYIY